MARPYGLLRAGFPYVKTLGMRRLTNFPVDIALGAEGRMYILCRQENAALIRKYTYDDEDKGSIGSNGEDEGQFQWPVSIIADAEEILFDPGEAFLTGRIALAGQYSCISGNSPALKAAWRASAR